jgi:hypothetical protein
MQQNGISCWWVSIASLQFNHCSSPIIVGLQYLILPILDKPNMGLFWVVVYWCVILVVRLVFCQRLSSTLKKKIMQKSFLQKNMVDTKEIKLVGFKKV